MRKTATWFLLFLLLVVPFLNRELGALIWMCCFIVYICQQIFSGRPFTTTNEPDKRGDDEDEPRAS